MKPHSCTIIRVKRVQLGTMNIMTGRFELDREETRVEPCDTPLFADRERQAGVCNTCAAGWSMEGNRPATEAEAKKFYDNAARKLEQLGNRAAN